MKLQIALDCTDISTAVKILEQTHEYIDIVEIGTPLVLSVGMYAVREIKKAYPHLILLADTKIMDAGEYEAAHTYEAGADIVTVMGITNDDTISGVVKAAKTFGKESFADMLSVEDLAQRTKDVDKLGVNYVSVHTAFDLHKQISTPIEDLRIIKASVQHAKAVIAGGVSIDSIAEIVKISPEIVIIGGAITGATDMKQAAQLLRNALSGNHVYV